MRYNFNKLKMKANFSLFIFFLGILSFHFSFAQTRPKKRGKMRITGYAGSLQTGKVKNYKKQDVWKYFGNGKNLDSTITFKDDVRNGLFTSYYPDGKKFTEGNYLNNMKVGTWNKWYESGNKGQEINYSNGKLDGISKTWHKNGTLLSQIKYENGKEVYSWNWYSNGKFFSSSYWENGLEDGTFRIYDSLPDDTLPIQIINYSNGKKNGLKLERKNGIVVEEDYYKEDLLNGVSRTWDTNGKLLTEENY